MIEIYINDQPYEAQEHSKLLEVCKAHDIPVPTLCYHPALPGFAGCRLCVVELRKGEWSKLVTACEYPVQRPEHFYTNSEKVRKSRRMTAKLLLARAPEAKDVLENLLDEEIEPEFEPLDVFNKKCVLCGLCYRVCHVQGTAAIYTTGRGANKVVETPFKEANDDCIGCGSCAAVCPTGAIRMVEPDGKRAIWRHRFELLACPICGERHITQRMVTYMQQKTGLPEEEILICPDCRQKKLGSGMLTGLSHDEARRAFVA
jgi:NADH dehydrogenase/NADH:ubiquinone oxidoreductase subunit G